MSDFAENDNRAFSTEVIAELEGIRPAERLDEKAFPGVPHENVELPDFGVTEVE